MFFPTALGNVSGTLMVGIIFMHFPTIPLIISLFPSFIFGGLGGILSWILYNWLIKSFPIFDKPES